MANDIDMYRDMVNLEREGEEKQAMDLGLCWFYAFIEPNEIELEKAKQHYIKKYGSIDNYV